MRITLIEADAQGARPTEVELPEGSTVADALRAAGRTVESGWGLALWGKRTEPTAVLEDEDRVELCAPLLVDPKEARRERAERQGDVRQVTCGRHGGKRSV